MNLRFIVSSIFFTGTDQSSFRVTPFNAGVNVILVLCSHRAYIYAVLMIEFVIVSTHELLAHRIIFGKKSAYFSHTIGHVELGYLNC